MTQIKNVLITGCSSGIGLCAAQTLKQQGYRVLATCRKQSDVDNLQNLGLEAFRMDLDDADSVIQTAQQVLTLTEGQLYGLVNNAGFGLYGELSSMSRQQLEHQFSANFFAVHQLTCLLLPAMKASGQGRIIQISSVMGLISLPLRGAYAASKHALEAWSDALRMELKGSGIFVSLIEPGPISTHFSQNVVQIQQNKQVKNPKIAQRFTGKPEDVVKKILHALDAPKPKVRYPVTRLTQAVILLKRLLPRSCMDKVLNIK